MNKQKAIIWDLDGTLSNSEACDQHQEEIARGEWGWFEEIARDAPAILPTMRILWDQLDSYNTLNIEPIIITARQEAFRDITRKWLLDHGIDQDNSTLFLRPPEMNGWADWSYKLAMYEEIKKDYEVIAAYDDKPEIINLWTSVGIETVIQVYHNSKR